MLTCNLTFDLLMSDTFDQRYNPSQVTWLKCFKCISRNFISFHTEFMISWSKKVRLEQNWSITTQSWSGYRIDNRIPDGIFRDGQGRSDNASSTDRSLWYLSVPNKLIIACSSWLVRFSMNFESKNSYSGTKSHELLEIIWFENL